jgi:hypothetical protein
MLATVRAARICDWTMLDAKNKGHEFAYLDRFYAMGPCLFGLLANDDKWSAVLDELNEI